MISEVQILVLPRASCDFRKVTRIPWASVIWVIVFNRHIVDFGTGRQILYHCAREDPLK